jgi:hypothetical protein
MGNLLGNPTRSMPHGYEKVQVDNTIEIKFSILKHELNPHAENFNGTVVSSYINFEASDSPRRTIITNPDI